MWWKKEQKPSAPLRKAVAYYRHSAQDRQENSIPIQRDRVRAFAREHGIEIIREFADAGKSGLSTEGRDSFNEMLNDYVAGGKEGFELVLALDVSRWGRFQDIDLSAYYTGLCQKHGKQVVYTTIGFPKQDDLVHFLHLNIERYRAATYSRELSGKVFDGCAKIAEQGFRAGGPPPYGLHRLLLDEQRKPVQVLSPGQRKSIQNQRVTLAPGDEKQVATVRRIFSAFAGDGRNPKQIAAALNEDGIPSPGGKRWTEVMVRDILTNELYAGVMVYNKTTQRLQSACRRNPRDAWIRTKGAFPGIVDKELFDKAQEIFAARAAERARKYSAEGMLEQLGRLHEQYGMANPRLVSAAEGMVSAATYAKRFASLDMAYQSMYADVRERIKRDVVEQIKGVAGPLEEFGDYVVVGGSYSVLVQPSIQMQKGYSVYWPFRPDGRVEVDITLGVPLSNSGKYEILGYLAFPRLLTGGGSIRLFTSSEYTLGLYAHPNLDVLKELMG
ncbi:MAG TPA: recombinase family protein [Planctomycetota bacterium]|nr:recombinase family protein [Planctomycetota bacterium]